MLEKSWEYEGSTVEEATRIALEELGLERDDIHIEILDEEQKGFLGIGGKGARIRVELIGEWEILGKKENRGEDREEAKPDEEDIEQDQAPVSNTARPLRMIKEILEIMDVDAMVDVDEDEGAVMVDIWGEDVAILIGKEGRTLGALQYLVNVGCRRNRETSKRITVDIEGYNSRKKTRIEKEAKQLAEKAVSSGKTVELPPMSASDRKTIHIILRDFNGVRTESEGEDRERRVVIHPTGNSST